MNEKYIHLQVFYFGEFVDMTLSYFTRNKRCVEIREVVRPLAKGCEVVFVHVPEEKQLKEMCRKQTNLSTYVRVKQQKTGLDHEI